jgi:hypothetical protein
MPTKVINTTRKNRVWVANKEVTTALIQGSVSDDDILNSSIMTSRGELVLAQYNADGSSNLDLNKTIYPIGSAVIIATEFPNGAIVRHPRGLLYVMNSTVNLKDKTITLSLGCSLAMLAENEESFPTGVKKLWAFIDARVRFACTMDAQDLGTLDSALSCTGSVIYQNQYGRIKTLSITSAQRYNNPRVICSDTQTAIDFELTDDANQISPRAFLVEADFNKYEPSFSRNGQEENGYDLDPPELSGGPEGQSRPEFEGIDWAYEVTGDDDAGGGGAGGGGSSGAGGGFGGPGGGGGAGGGGGTIGNVQNRIQPGDEVDNKGPSKKWSQKETEGEAEYDRYEYLDWEIFNGMKKKQEKKDEDALYQAYCGFFYREREDDEPVEEEEMVWSYGIEKWESVKTKDTYKVVASSATTKWYNDNGQEKSSETLEYQTWKVVGGSLINSIASKAFAFSNEYKSIADKCFGNANTAYGNRDGFPTNSNAYLYYQCIAGHWLGAANNAVSRARLWWNIGRNVNDYGAGTVAWSKRSTTETEYGKGGEVLRVVSKEYVNSKTLPEYQKGVLESIDRTKNVPLSAYNNTAGVTLVSVKQKLNKYNPGGSITVCEITKDILNPVNNSVSYSWDGEGRSNSTPFVGSPGGAGNNEPLYDIEGNQIYKDPDGAGGGAAALNLNPFESYDEGPTVTIGQFSSGSFDGETNGSLANLTYPSQWNGFNINSSTGRVQAPVECTGETGSVLLRGYAKSKRTYSSNSVGWLGNNRPYTLRSGFPLPFRGDTMQSSGGGCFPKSGGLGLAWGLCISYANILSAKEGGAAEGCSITESMRPEFYNMRPYSPVEVQIESAQSGFVGFVKSATYAFDQSQSVVNLQLIKHKTLNYNAPQVEIVYGTELYPPNGEVVSNETTGPDPLAPTFTLPPSPTYDPNNFLVNGYLGVDPGLVTSAGGQPAPGDIPENDASQEGITDVTIVTSVGFRMYCDVLLVKSGNYTWNYGGIGLPGGMALDLGTVDTPYPKDYDFNGIVDYVEPVAVP